MNYSEEGWRQALLPLNSTIKQAANNLNQSSMKIVIVVSKYGRLEGTISDGDIRRALLQGVSLDSDIKSIIHRDALVVPSDIGHKTVIQLMSANKIHQIPVVDDNKKVVGLHLWNEIATKPTRSNVMVIMAGGRGTRLGALTENCPKPLIEVAGKPMLEHIIERGKSEGFSQFVLAIHYLGHMIEDHFEDGHHLGVRISYLKENSPLGTAGALGLLKTQPDSPFIVTNGDVLSDIQYGELLDFHVRSNASATMAVRLHEWQHPFGVVKTNGMEIVGFEEKPIARTHINAGVYVLEPEALTLFEEGKPCDMPSLFERLKINKKRIVAYPMHEPWLDVGRPDDLEQVNRTKDSSNR